MSCSNKSVSFAGSATMRLALHANDYTRDEIDACYYSQEDFRSFKDDVRRTVRMIEMKQKIDETACCVRGAECFTKPALKKKSFTRKHARVAVFRELDLQFEEGVTIYDDELIASVYQQHTSECTTSAYVIGLSDEMIAMEPRKELSLERRYTPTMPSSIASNLFRLTNTGNRSFRLRRTNNLVGAA